MRIIAPRLGNRRRLMLLAIKIQAPERVVVEVQKNVAQWAVQPGMVHGVAPFHR